MNGLVAIALAAAFELAAAATVPIGGLVSQRSSQVLPGAGRVSTSLRLRGGGKDKQHWCLDVKS